MAGLRFTYPAVGPWMVRFLGENRYQIEAPEACLEEGGRRRVAAVRHEVLARSVGTKCSFWGWRSLRA